MSWTLTAEVGAFLLAVLICVAVIALLWPHRDNRRAGALIWLMVAVAGWASIATLQLASTEPAVIYVLDGLLMGFVALLAVTWCYFAVVFTDSWEWVRPSTVAFAAGVPILTQVLVWTNPYHGLMWTELETRWVESAGLLAPYSEPGLWWEFVHAPHSYFLILVGSVLIARSAISAWSVYRGQAIALLAAMAVPTSVNLLYNVTGLVVIDYTSVGFAVSGVCLAFGLYRYELVELVPVARDVVVDEMRDGMIVLDANGRIVDHNAAAGSILDCEGSAIGRVATDVLPFEITVTDGGRLSTYREVDLSDAGETNHYRLSETDITDGTGTATGRLLVIQDITQLKRRERQLEATNQELEILNRIVRHDIRNDMNVVHGHASILDEVLDDHREHLEPILHGTEHTIGLTRTVGDLLEAITGQGEMSLEPIDLGRVLAVELEKVRNTHEDAEFVLTERPSGVTVRANPMLSSVFTNLLTNAVNHNDTDEPTITVDVGVEPESVTVRIADNGPGVPEGQREEIFGRGQKGLESPGSGIGLYLVDRLIDLYDGSVHVEENDPRGAVFIVELRRVTSDHPRDRPQSPTEGLQ